MRRRPIAAHFTLILTDNGVANKLQKLVFHPATNKMSLLASIPAPTRELVREEDPAPAAASAPARPVKEIPPYGQRKGFVPRRQDDFGDGKLNEFYHNF